MDSTEKHVHNHLVHCGYSTIVYEPDGNVPPDFLVNGSIAIEVRRLNQNYFDQTSAKGLEEVGIPLWNKMKVLLTSLGPPKSNESWFVHFTYSRPVEPWKPLERKLRQALQSFMTSPTPTKGVIATGQGFELEIYCRTSKPHSDMFVLAGCTDQESGGWLLAEMETNIRHCASEKAHKIAKYQANYPTWWLALVDHIGYGLDTFDTDMFRKQVSILHSWDKILIINPNDCTKWFEI